MSARCQMTSCHRSTCPGRKGKRAPPGLKDLASAPEIDGRIRQCLFSCILNDTAWHLAHRRRDVSCSPTAVAMDEQGHVAMTTSRRLVTALFAAASVLASAPAFAGSANIAVAANFTE